jgi:hypothetical protein
MSAPSARLKPSLDRLCRAATLAKSPYQPTVSHAHLMRGSPDTLSRQACLSRQGRSDRSHFAPLLTDLTGKQHRSPRSATVPATRIKPSHDLPQAWSRAQQGAPPRLTSSLGLSLGLGRSHNLARSQPRPQEKSPPRPPGPRTDYTTGDTSLPYSWLAALGYKGTRPMSHLRLLR